MKIFHLILLLLMTGLTTIPDTVLGNGLSVPGRSNNAHDHHATHYFIDPVKGDDRNSGRQPGIAWKSFGPVNEKHFLAGDQISILKPGDFRNSLVICGSGTASKPITIDFAKGEYHFYDIHAYRKKLNITNTNDVPDGRKAIAILITGSKYVNVQAKDVRLVLHAKMIETCIDSSENISLQGLSYDYHTPTVSEFKVADLQADHADLEVNKDSYYLIRDSLLNWQGDGWQYRASWYWQVFDPANGYLTRTGLSLDKSRFSEIGPHKLRIYFPFNPGFKVGLIYQTRDVTRDCAGIFMQRSKNILLKNIRIYYMHGMGVVSQFCENITMDAITVKPDESSGRTCAAWADILHFAGCKGSIEVKNSYLSASNDDAVNVHGIHLRIVGQPSQNQLKVRFMHGQTYGFNAYMPGDSIELINGKTLIPFAARVVKRSEILSDKEILLTLEEPVNHTLKTDDAVENITWTPRVNIHHNTITSIPTRGILVTTRRKILIDDNKFIRLSSAGVLVEDDAEGWYESGPVRDLTISNNHFFKCGEAVVNIHPENAISDGPVHKNIRITGNEFVLNGSTALSAKSTANIRFSENFIRLPRNANANSITKFADCTNTMVSRNTITYENN